MPPRENLTKDEYRNLDHETIINHFHEKLLKLAGMLNTPVAKEIAAHRQQVMIDFWLSLMPSGKPNASL